MGAALACRGDLGYIALTTPAALGKSSIAGYIRISESWTNYELPVAFYPPRNYVKSTQAWRLGKIAVISVMAALAAAGGLAFPNTPPNAAAQGALGGYTYTQRICQEYGQQPRYYGVRDGQAAYNGGNSDSGWLIVLVRGSTFVPGEYTFNSITDNGGWGSITNALNDARNQITPPHVSVVDPNAPVGSRITATDGTSGFVTNNGRRVVIDRNNNGVLDTGDLTITGSGNSALHYFSRGRYQEITAPSNYGTQYVRWAHIAWCR